ncbi:hypothetical protein [Cetobacterium sp.]|uniref:hypothetical protein n=1 Tax=Cetobacterium sp. TaxID=2071632 RepID=UPI003F408162
MGNQDKIVKLETRGRKKGIPKVWKNISAKIEEGKFTEYEAIARKIMNDETYSINTFFRENLDKVFDPLQYKKIKNDIIENAQEENFYLKVDKTLHLELFKTIAFDEIDNEVRKSLIQGLKEYKIETEILKYNQEITTSNIERNIPLEILLTQYKQQIENLKTLENCMIRMFEEMKKK